MEITHEDFHKDFHELKAAADKLYSSAKKLDASIPAYGDPRGAPGEMGWHPDQYPIDIKEITGKIQYANNIISMAIAYIN